MRTKPPTRRHSINLKIPVVLDNQNQIEIIITVGFFPDGRPAEVFCADWKAGTSLHAIVQDACILLSRALQHGDTPAEFARRSASPPSLIGTIAIAIRDMIYVGEA